MLWIMIIAVSALGVSVPIVENITSHRREVVKIKLQMLQEEVALEKMKQQNYLLETEKMKVELERMKLEYTSDTDKLLQIDNKREDSSSS